MSTTAEVITKYDEVVRANRSAAWDTITAVAECQDGLYGAWGEVLDLADTLDHTDGVVALHDAFVAYQLRLAEQLRREQWTKEFDLGYDVPDAIAQADDLGDLSWHNDACPSFGVADEDAGRHLRIWVEHPDAARREHPDAARFVVWSSVANDDDDAVLYEGDDADVALATYRAALASVLA